MSKTTVKTTPRVRPLKLIITPLFAVDDGTNLREIEFGQIRVDPADLQVFVDRGLAEITAQVQANIDAETPADVEEDRAAEPTPDPVATPVAPPTPDDVIVNEVGELVGNDPLSPELAAEQEAYQKALADHKAAVAAQGQADDH